MTGRSFVDTNVLVYRIDQAEPDKRAISERLLGNAQPGMLVLSTQVLQEFYVVSTRKLAKPLSRDEAARAVDYLSELPVVGVDREFVRAAIRLSRKAQLSLWDSLVVHAAVVSGCERVLTEDLQHGAVFDGVRVENPFKSGY